MKVAFWAIGKTNEKYLEQGTSIFQKRLNHYLPFEYKIFPDIRNGGKLSAKQLKIKEAQLILQHLKNDDYLILLDEQGKEFDSLGFAQWMERNLQRSQKRLIFLVGGAFGFDQQLYERADVKIALSKMTFSHQMVRLFFLEQLYRAMTILRNEPYHNL